MNTKAYDFMSGAGQILKLQILLPGLGSVTSPLRGVFVSVRGWEPFTLVFSGPTSTSSSSVHGARGVD